MLTHINEKSKIIKNKMYIFLKSVIKIYKYIKKSYFHKHNYSLMFYLQNL